MKTSLAIIKAAEDQGISLWVEGGALRYKAARGIASDLKSQLVNHKNEIIEILSHELITGLPCGGCGSVLYRRIPNGFSYPDGSMTTGWWCGGKECHVKLYSGNKEADHATQD